MTIKQPIYEVQYILHSIISGSEKKTENMTDQELRELLSNGMVSLIKAERIYEQK